MGKGDQVENFVSFPRTNLTGFFTYPISCTGTLVSINARGFCRKTNKSVKLFIGTVQFADETFNLTTLTRIGQHFIEAECDTSTTIPESEYYRGTINVDNQKILVLEGEFLGVRFNPNCTEDSCLFQPAIVNETSEHILLFVDDNFDLEQQTHTSLLFSATCKYVYIHD